MIERQTINGRGATISYVDSNFQPTSKRSSGHFAKVHFDDGEMLILRAPVNVSQKVRKHVNDAIDHLDPSEDKVRLVIEKGLAQVSGPGATKRRMAGKAIDHVMKHITKHRMKAIKDAFRKHLKGKLDGI